MGQKENQTGIHPLHMGQIKKRSINTFANNDGRQDRHSLRMKMQTLGYIAMDEEYVSRKNIISREDLAYTIMYIRGKPTSLHFIVAVVIAIFLLDGYGHPLQPYQLFAPARQST